MITLADLVTAGGRLHGEPEARDFGDIAYDSRLTRPGELFVALRTARADGHDHIPAALASGATGVLCSYPPAHAVDVTIVVSDDPAALIQRWAAQQLRAVAPKVVAVTGSVGKTAAVGAIATLLGELGPTFRTRQSFNSLLGVPIALARLDPGHRYAVLEFGADRFGEIEQLATLFPPQIAVITRVAEVHLDIFGTLDGVAREQAAALRGLPRQGWAVLNGDDPWIRAMRPHTDAQALTFGCGESCALRADRVRLARDGTRFDLHWQGQRAEVFLPLLGRPAVTTALAAVGVALACGLPFERAAQALATVTPNAGRLRLLPAQGGGTLLDDSFSASLPSVHAALDTLAALPARRRIVVLGAAMDLPADRDVAAAAIGRRIAEVADLLVCVGETGAAVVEAARTGKSALPTQLVDTTTAALAALPARLDAGDLVLVKGGAETRMERVTAGLVDPTVDSAAALVRQEPAWQSVRTTAPDRPTWLRIDLDAIGHNVRRLRDLAGVPLLVTLKADAYGHGALRVARIALANGAYGLAVATLGEARVLRENGIAAPILVLGYTPPWQAREVVDLRVACTIFDDDAARAIGEVASRREREVPVHLKVDTGMARLGVAPEQAGRLLKELYAIPGLRVEGVYTHFATADSAEEAFARIQLRRFTMLLDELARAGLRPPLAHAANSAALLRFPEARFDMVRPGIACYGVHPSPETPLPVDFQPALSFHTEVAQVKELPAGTPISYGGAFVTVRASRIATIPVGYGDGFRRSPHWHAVLVRGRRAPVVGRVTMDYTLIDVTEIAGVRRGDPVVLIGAQGNDAITADEVAEWLGTISYEVVTTILSRVPREVAL